MLTWSVVARSLLSWFPIDQNSPLFQLLVRVTEPIIGPIRKIIPTSGMVDLSPMAALVLLIVSSQLVVSVSRPL